MIKSPEYEWREAARFALIPYRQFRFLPVHEQEAIIAHYRAHAQAETVIAHANRPKKTPTGPKPPAPKRGRRRGRRR
jgi:hypothetical protein